MKRYLAPVAAALAISLVASVASAQALTFQRVCKYSFGTTTDGRWTTVPPYYIHITARADSYIAAHAGMVEGRPSRTRIREKKDRERGQRGGSARRAPKGHRSGSSRLWAIPARFSQQLAKNLQRLVAESGNPRCGSNFSVRIFTSSGCMYW